MGREEFLESMRDADIVRKHKNLVYVQTLKFLQTSGGRGGKGHPDRNGAARRRARARQELMHSQGADRSPQNKTLGSAYNRRRDQGEVSGARDSRAQ